MKKQPSTDLPIEKMQAQMQELFDTTGMSGTDMLLVIIMSMGPEKMMKAMEGLPESALMFMGTCVEYAKVKQFVAAAKGGVMSGHGEA